MIGPDGLLLVVPHIFAVPVSFSFSFIGGVAKKVKQRKLGCEKYFCCRVTY
jgi:hypothetical protein